MKFWNWLDCFFFGHIWKEPFHLHQEYCLRCGKDYVIPEPPAKGWLER